MLHHLEYNGERKNINGNRTLEVQSEISEHVNQWTQLTWINRRQGRARHAYYLEKFSYIGHVLSTISFKIEVVWTLTLFLEWKEIYILDNLIKQPLIVIDRAVSLSSPCTRLFPGNPQVYF